MEKKKEVRVGVPFAEKIRDARVLLNPYVGRVSLAGYAPQSAPKMAYSRLSKSVLGEELSHPSTSFQRARIVGTSIEQQLRVARDAVASPSCEESTKCS